MPHSPPHSEPPAPRPWLVRIPEIFEAIAPDVLQRFAAETTRRLGHDAYLIKTASPQSIHHSEAAKFAVWNLPMDHTWPCHPGKLDGFVEKAAQALRRKFGEAHPQGVFIGPLHPTSPDRYYRGLASNLRGRTLQLFPDLPVRQVEEQDPAKLSLFGLVGKEGLFCGLQTPRDCNGFYPGGSRFIDHDSPDTISRAGAKIAEALHYLKLHRPIPPEGSHWLELGASPGGMTSELLAHAQRVTAVDRAPLDHRLDGYPGLKFIHADVTSFEPPGDARFDALLCDLNGPAEISLEQVVRLSRWLRDRALVIFTLKLPRVEDVVGPCTLSRFIVAQAEAAGLRLFAQTHLTYNRHEFTLFFES